MSQSYSPPTPAWAGLRTRPRAWRSVTRALGPEAAGKHQGACGGRDKHEQGEHVVVAGDQFQPTPGELDCPPVAAVRREKQQPARQQPGLRVVAALVANRQ